MDWFYLEKRQSNNMKVIAMFDYYISPICTADGDIKEGQVYTVKEQGCHYSSYAKRWVNYYGFYETGNSLWEQGIFIPLSEIDEKEIVYERARV